MENKGFTKHLLQKQKWSNCSTPHKRAGFTFIELTVSLMVIALISLISIPLLVNYQKTTKLRSEARVLATNLRLTQQLAITEQIIYNLKLFPGTASYQIINSETSAIIKNVDLDSEIIINQISNLTNNTVQFIPTGAAVETGSIDLTNSKNEISILRIKPSGYIEIIDQ